MQITINAHATLEDIYEWLTPFVDKASLHVALEVYFPKFRLHPFTRWSQFLHKAQRLQANQLWLDLVPIPPMRSKVDPQYQNRERFSIYLPVYRNNGLQEAWFTTVATKPQQLKVWRAIIRAVRKQTTRGLWIWNDLHQTKTFSKQHGYSPRVAVLHTQGLELLPLGGSNRLFMTEPDTDSVSR
jgi:hypothetical protein